VSGGCIRIEPYGIEILAADGESIMAAARRHGLYWPTICGGNGTCRTCYLVVVDGGENFVPAGPSEAQALTAITRSFSTAAEPLRLACQANISGDVVVVKYGVRPAAEALNGRGDDR
jgi:ferredoxin, 2Fe-2S